MVSFAEFYVCVACILICCCQVSKSKKAQEQLAELEKLSAPFEDQLIEAAKFVGQDIEAIAQSLDDTTENGKDKATVQYFGREEWLLRWLLKKLLIPRKTASSWTLLLYLLRTIPATNAAKILAERGFVSILKLELEELCKEGNKSVPGQVKEDKKSSKKRKRSGEVVASSVTQDPTALPQLLEAIFAVVRYVTEASEVLSSAWTDKLGRGAAFSAEYMQKAIRTSSQEAGQILGAWLALCAKALPYIEDKSRIEHWLSPFVRIWSCHTTDTISHLNFSLHCTSSVLELLAGIKSGQLQSPKWAAQLEQLIARNIINPTKTAMAANPESDLLETLTRTSVIYNVSNAPLLFVTAIRSVKPHGSRRRRGSDDAWLLHVFKKLRESMPPQTSRDGKAISDMLQLAIEYKVMLDLPVLRAVTLEFALAKEHVSWQLVATMIKLDANVFLIEDKDTEEKLLDNLLARITNASFSEGWAEISRQVVDEVVVPLMNEFAKARDLSGFMRHWHAQLMLFERMSVKLDEPIDELSAWEDEALHVELRKLFEASLTLQQIEQILEWLSAEVKISPSAVCVLLDAIAGSLVSEAVVDAVGLRLYSIMFEDNAIETLDGRYKWRSLRVVSRTVDCTTYSNIDLLLQAWEGGLQRVLAKSGEKARQGSNLGFAENFKLACSLWSAPESGTLKDQSIKPVALEFLRTANSLMISNEKVKYGKITNIEGDDGWLIATVVHTMCVKYPKVLVLALDLEEKDLNSLLQGIISECSTGDRQIWLAALSNDEILSCSKLTGMSTADPTSRMC